MVRLLEGSLSPPYRPTCTRLHPGQVSVITYNISVPWTCFTFSDVRNHVPCELPLINGQVTIDPPPFPLRGELMTVSSLKVYPVWC